MSVLTARVKSAASGKYGKDKIVFIHSGYDIQKYIFIFSVNHCEIVMLKYKSDLNLFNFLKE